MFVFVLNFASRGLELLSKIFPFLDALASLRPGMTGQNLRIQGALPENPLIFFGFVKY